MARIAQGRPGRSRIVVLAVATLFAALATLMALGHLSGAAASSDPVIAAAGDIACDPGQTNYLTGNATTCHQKDTANLLGGADAVLLLGDNQYYCGSLLAFQQSYDASWGVVKGKTYPALGNHEYITTPSTQVPSTGCDASNAGAAGYFGYFGAAAHQDTNGYYSYDLGAWHLVALNSACNVAAVGCSAGSPQGQWLQADLDAHPAVCTLAYFHVPLFSSGGRADVKVAPLWQTLQDHGVDVVLNGHDHIYERFDPQRWDAATQTGVADATGPREFVVGTGGANHTSLSTIFPNSVVRNTTSFGVLEMTLHPSSYAWSFEPEARSPNFTDAGTASCHHGGDTTPPSQPTGLTATALSGTQASLSWAASTDNSGAVAGYRIRRDGVQIATTKATTYTDGALQPGTSYGYTVTAFDGSGNTSAPSSVASVTTPVPPPVQNAPPPTPADPVIVVSPPVVPTSAPRRVKRICGAIRTGTAGRYRRFGMRYCPAGSKLQQRFRTGYRSVAYLKVPPHGVVSYRVRYHKRTIRQGAVRG